MRYPNLKIWILPFLLLLMAWVDQYFPITSNLVHRAEPISISALLISVALTARALGCRGTAGGWKR